MSIENKRWNNRYSPEFKEEFGERYGIEKLGLFGSVARGEQKEDSDIDICVKLQDPDYFTRMEIKESLEERFMQKWMSCL